MLLSSWTQTHHPQPDYRRLLAALNGQGDPNHVPFLELFADPEILAAFLGEPVVRVPDIAGGVEPRRAAIQAVVDQKISFWHALGYDAIWQGPVVDLPFRQTAAADTAELARDRREWMDEGRGPVTSWEEFERYPWPRLEEVDYGPMEYMSSRLPEGMGMLVEIGGIYETASWLMGYETFSLALYEQPELVQAIFERVRELFLPVLDATLQMERVIGIWVGDDLGFKTGPLVSPKHLRQYVFPIHQEMARRTHAAGMPYLLHSCGNLRSVMGDLIDTVGIDAKHSYEDVIEPVEDFAAQHAGPRPGKIAVIGGVDLDVLTRGTEGDVRVRTRHVLTACAPTRAYVLGTGNSVANYIPMENFLAMVDEGWRFNQPAG